jgi:DNA invertase Pin-like site-specific DNA recombinase
LSTEVVAAGRFVAYLRLFKDKRDKPGFSLEAQRKIVCRHVANGELLAEFIEIETGKKGGGRPQLAAALATCRGHDARLLIARLGRLAGNLPVVCGLIDSGIDFIAADNPHADRSTIRLLAAIAEEETRIASARTKAALAAAKARGVKLGNPNGARALHGKQIGNGAAVAAIKSRAQQSAIETYAQIQAIIADEGTTSLAAISRRLNARGVRTPRGGLWYPTSVKLVLDRFKPAARDDRAVARGSQKAQSDAHG